MNKKIRILILYLTTGLVWGAFMQLLFVASGAQQVLADPARQSSKFIKAFTEYPPLPRMAGDSSFVWKGFFVCGLLAATVFLVVNSRMKAGWMKRGLLFGFMHWALMVPWFEFYLPYNVMNEPMSLVLLEAGLWLVVLLLTGLYMSAIMNLKVGAGGTMK